MKNSLDLEKGYFVPPTHCFYSRAISGVEEREGWADCVYLRFEKAFGKIPHKRLMWKLQKLGEMS